MSESRGYKLENNDRDVSRIASDNLEPTPSGVRNKLEIMAKRRQKEAGFFTVTSWALYHKDEFRDLVGSITSLLDDIEKLFPAPQQELLRLLQQEVTGVKDNQSLKLIEGATEDVDNLLQAAAKEALAGHQYLNVVIKGKAQTGNAISSDWKGNLPGGSSHVYSNIAVEETGKVLIGNKYGGRDFWDE